MARSIVVRYVNSSVSVTNRTPMVCERTMTFQLIHSAQSYLTESGHDYALQMCAGAYLSLNNTIPMDTGVSVLEPFSMGNESFDGLTDSSHYVYIQNWNITVQEINGLIALDPCVLRGNCSYLFPSNITGTVLPGDVIYGNQLFAPVLPPPYIEEDFEAEFCGVIERGDNLVFTHDPAVVFLEDWAEYELRHTGTFMPDSALLVCHIYDKEGNFFREYFAANCDNRRLLSINNSLNESPGQDINKGAMSWGYTTRSRVPVYTDPTSQNESVSTLAYGSTVRAEIGVTLTVNGVEFYKISGAPVGTGWIKVDDLVVINPNQLAPLVDCEGLNAENNGPEECV